METVAGSQSYDISIKIIPGSLETKPIKKRIRRVLLKEIKETDIGNENTIDWEKLKSILCKNFEQDVKLNPDLLLVSLSGKWKLPEPNGGSDAAGEGVEETKTDKTDNIQTQQTQQTQHILEVQYVTIKEREDEKKKVQEKLSINKTILKIRRSANKSPAWERYFSLSRNWPTKAGNMFPLEIPDKVREKKSVLQPMIHQLRDERMQQLVQQMAQLSGGIGNGSQIGSQNNEMNEMNAMMGMVSSLSNKNSVVSQWLEYTELCFAEEKENKEKKTKVLVDNIPTIENTDNEENIESET
jgi:hypothetical protein